jgi:signal transduction histidine kinase
MSTGHFRFAADILRRLGEELNPSPDQGIVELVKNAYDADAVNCRVELVNTDEPGGTVRVVDDGDGMTDRAILEGWLVLGRSPKNPTAPTRLGRHPAGSKGLGRLAALRMGTTASVTTRPRKDRKVQYSLVINWPDYERAEMVDDVPLTIHRKALGTTSKPGTEVSLERLRTKINRTDVKKLARGLILLADPFNDDPSGFKPVLSAPEYEDLERLVSKRYFQEADYHLSATVDQLGMAQARVLDFKGKVLFKATHDELSHHRDKLPYACPRCDFDLWVFIMNQVSFQLRTTTLAEVRRWLASVGGVHVYQNDIRVAPYGNPGNDWLDMNLRRAKSPEERPSTNTSIGRVAIHGGEDSLVQKTDRSGFIETESFTDLRAFAQDAMNWMARRRMDRALQRRARDRAAAPTNVQQAKSSVEKAIATVPSQARKKITDAFGAYDRTRERESNQLRKEVQLYRTLSTAGITAATFAHESSGNPIKVVAHSIKIIERRAKSLLGARYEETLKRPIESIVQATSALAVLGNATLSLIEHDKRRLGRVDVHSTIDGVLQIFEPFLRGRDVAVETEFAGGNPFLRASQAAVESIVTNLLNNSLAAFERSNVPARRIVIHTSVENGSLSVDVSDNGPGIDGIDVKDIWLPGETTRPNGTGLGLAIVRDTVLDLGGAVDAVPHSLLGGAQFTIELPILGR